MRGLSDLKPKQEDDMKEELKQSLTGQQPELSSSELLDAINARMSMLGEYVNKKELDKLEWLRSQIKAGDAAKKMTENFLKHVPVGAYDENRRGYDKYI